MALIKYGISFPIYAAIITIIPLLCNATGTAVWSDVSETCEAGHGALQLKMTPAYLASVFPYLGHQDCTDGNVCRNIPSVCPLTSCCVSQYERSNGTSMRCGCLDGSGQCVPVKSFRLGWESCGGDSGGRVTSSFEVTRLLDEDGMKCSVSNASVEFAVLEDGPIRITISGSECLKSPAKYGRDFDLTSDGQVVYQVSQDTTFTENGAYSRLCRDVLEYMGQLEIATVLDERQLFFLRSGFPVVTSVSTLTKTSSNSDTRKCLDSSVAIFPMNPAFLFGLSNELAAAWHDGCSAAGQCNGRPHITPNICHNAENCCVLTRDISERQTGCECVEGIHTCLEYKEFQVNLDKCTEDGNMVSTVYTVVALNIDQQCKERTSLLDMYLHANGKIRITMNHQKCIPSSSGSSHLLVEHEIYADHSVEKFLPTLKAVMKNIQGEDLIRFLGEKLTKKIASLA